jgi:hypothetical protein
MYVLLYCGVCTGVRLLPPGENPIAVRNNNKKKKNKNVGTYVPLYVASHFTNVLGMEPLNRSNVTLHTGIFFVFHKNVRPIEKYFK